MNPELAARLQKSVEQHKKKEAKKVEEEKITKKALETNNPFFGQDAGSREKALAALNKTELEGVRQKLAGIEVPQKFPEGTGEVELTEEDLEEIK